MPLDTSSTTPTGANHSEYFAMLCSELPPVPGGDPPRPTRRARRARWMPSWRSPPTTPSRHASPCEPATGLDPGLDPVVAADTHAADALRSVVLALAADDPE